ncbi:MAG: tyrosine-type recombinase/integrase [Clostridiales bacterium]|nr:tyrosine-type recombinase/integrase [Clostridiales bacterium]
MKVVQPIRNPEVLEVCYDIARAHDRRARKGSVSWELILVVGLNTSLRVSDFTRFRVRDLRGREYAQLQTKKTGKEARILINPAARKEINRLLSGRPTEEYAFQSRERDPSTKLMRPITRQRAYQIINRIARQAGIEERIGCHTLRKTFGYHYYKMTGDVVSLQRILGHSNRRDTLVYIGVIQEEIDESLKKFKLVGRRG